MERKRILRSQQGFTLIEIISVLVLIGILAAVAVPKYIDLQKDAANKAAEAAVAEGIAQVNLTSARYILRQGTVPTALTDLTGLASGALENNYAAGPFKISYSFDAATKEVTVTATGDATVDAKFKDASATGTTKLPTAET